jgi:MYXO-CTERM domain-containing protein
MGFSVIAAAGAMLGLAPAARAVPTVSSGTLVIQLDAATNVSTSGSAVTTWGDQANTGTEPLVYGGTFSAGGTAPTLVPNSINGQPAIHFAGAGYLAAATPSATVGGDDTHIQWTFFFVTQGATNPKGLFDTAPLVAGPIRFLNNNQVATQASNDSASDGLPVTLNSTGGTVFDFTFAGNAGLNNSTWAGFINGSSYTGSTNVYTGNRRVTWKTPTIGAINQGSPFFTGDVGEILIYQGVLTDADRQSVENYLIAKYVTPAPEPASMGVLGLGALALLRRRK